MTEKRFSIAVLLLGVGFSLAIAVSIAAYVNQQSTNAEQAAQNRQIVLLSNEYHADSDAIAAAQKLLIGANTSKLAADIELIRKLNYKVCVRINDTRGVLILQIIHERKAHIAPAPLVADLPLYACSPQFTDGAKILTPAQTRAYLAMLARGKKPGP